MEVRVNKGDSIWRIAKARKPEGVSTADFVQQILDMNDLDDPDKLKIGQVIQIPGEAPPTPRPKPVKIGKAEVTTGGPKGASAEGAIAVQPATPEDLMLLAKRNETLQVRDRVRDLGAVLQERYGNVRETMNVGPPLTEAPPDRNLPVSAQKRTGVANEVMEAAGIDPGKDQSRLPEEVMLDLDVLGLTPRRYEPAQPPRNPDYAALPPPRANYVGQAARLPSAPDRRNFTVGDPGGLLEEGNIDMSQRVRVDNGDGTFSTIRSKSFEFDGMEVLIPTLDPQGRQMTDEEAVRRFEETGEHLGKFDTPESATAYAKRLSERQNANIPRDPDHYIDLGTARWRDVFMRAPAEAGFLRRENARAEAKTRAMRPPNPRPRPPLQKMQLDMVKIREATQGPAFQPTRSIDGRK